MRSHGITYYKPFRSEPNSGPVNVLRPIQDTKFTIHGARHPSTWRHVSDRVDCIYFTELFNANHTQIWNLVNFHRSSDRSFRHDYGTTVRVQEQNQSTHSFSTQPHRNMRSKFYMTPQLYYYTRFCKKSLWKGQHQRIRGVVWFCSLTYWQPYPSVSLSGNRKLRHCSTGVLRKFLIKPSCSHFHLHNRPRVGSQSHQTISERLFHIHMLIMRLMPRKLDKCIPCTVLIVFGVCGSRRLRQKLGPEAKLTNVNKPFS